MFEVGFTEMILIVGLALIVLGPQRLPGLVKKVGRWAGRARSMARQLQMQLDHEISLEEISKTRPMQGGPPPGAEVSDNQQHNHTAVNPDPLPPSPAEPTIHAATGTDTARPVDISKPLQ